MKETWRCAACQRQSCCAEPGNQKYPKNCPTDQEAELLTEVARRYYEEPVVRQIALAAARTEAAGYCRTTRLEDTMDFARRIGAEHLGVAHCVGFMREAALLEEILLANGFRVITVCCKVGSVDKEAVGLRDDEKVHPGNSEALCNPIGQAELLNKASTDLNIALGLCVGHDSLLFKYSDAPVTVLVAKDRVLGHNPVAALYTSHSYYRRLLKR